jgi:ABC-type branched-subunit amino acid transport system ATPase component/ABC-type branched-subunit amino acid transport system permease subunit
MSVRMAAGKSTGRNESKTARRTAWFLGGVLVGLGLAHAVGRGWVPGLTPALLCVASLHALALVGLNLIFGVTGMLAFGQAAFMALPAYAAGLLLKLDVPFAVALAAAFTGTVLLARLVAAVFVRLPGVYLAVGTLGFGMVVEGLARAFPAWTGGASGLVFEHGRALGIDTWAVAAAAALGAGLVFYEWYVRDAVWRRLRTIRHDELAAAVLGIDVQREKARAFTIGCGYSAAAGLMLFQYVGVVIPEDAGVIRSLEQVGTLLLGGAGFFFGPVAGAFLADWFFVLSGYAARYEQLIYGLAFLLIVMFAPRGICGVLPAWIRRVRQPQPRPEERSRGASRRTAPGTALVAAAGSVPAAVLRDGAGAPPQDEAELVRTGNGPGQDICLRVQNISKSFGGVEALSDVSFDVRRGEVFALVGPNGAGKTTLFNIVSGVLPPTAGRVVVARADITGLPVHRRAALIGRSFQAARLVPDLSVIANVMARIDQAAPKLSEPEREAAARAQLEMFALGDLAARPAGAVSLGQRKLVDIARAAAGRPPLVLLDEPAVGLTADELVHLAETIGTLSAAGCAVVIVEHNIAFIAGIASRGIVLDSGRTIASGAVRDIMADAGVRAAYFGALS